jgi:hypothetical protein
LIIWPSIVERTWRSSPVPLHLGHVVGDVPGSAPDPEQVSQRASDVNHAGPAEHVVRLTTLRIGQHLVRLVDLLEARIRLRRGVDVGVPLLGKLAEGTLDVLVGSAAGHAQDVVEITLGRHAFPIVWKVYIWPEVDRGPAGD